MNQQRPDPDALLARVQAEEAQQVRGKLKIFFGATAGVGKTYAMLNAAHTQCAEGGDVVVGWVETHGRAETAALLQGLKVLSRHMHEYRGNTQEEFDLDAALARHPALLLVDELAHSNAEGSRHAKRWQDIEELLNAGINVYTTVNVQHIESLNDVVAQITGVRVRETIPDFLLEQADEVELVDLTPDDLLQRLREGKVYVPQQAERAMRHFFRKGNLIALRELALRHTADRVDDQMRVYRQHHAIAATWPTTERLLVCVSPSPLASRLVRAARRLAARLRSEWIVAYVETPAHARLPEADRDQVVQTLRLAEQLGAETVTLSGQHVSDELLSYARSRNVSKIVIGKTKRPRWQEILYGSVVDELTRHSDQIDVYVIAGEEESTRPPSTRVPERPHTWGAYTWGVAMVALTSACAALIDADFGEANLIMLYLLGVVGVARYCGRGPAIVASVLSVAAFDFFFVPPHLTFAVSDAQYLLTFTVLLLVALVISTLTVRMQQQAEAARQRERRTAALYAMSRELARTQDSDGLLQAAARHIGEVFESQVALLLPDAQGQLQAWEGSAGWQDGRGRRLAAQPLDDRERGVAQWVYTHQQSAGLGTATLPGAQALYVPLLASRGAVGVLGVQPAQRRRVLLPEQFHLLETFASQTALALERTTLATAAQQAQVQIEAEQLRNTLLSLVSHDLRTPMATITGAVSSLIEDRDTLAASARQELLQAIYEESLRLNRLVNNLLEMTRLESGAVQLKKEWQPLEEVVGATLTHLEAQLQRYTLTTDIPAELPMVYMDAVLIEQVLTNLLDNAMKYTPPGNPLYLSAWVANKELVVEVADSGPGIAPGDAERLFEKFYRGPALHAGGHPGFGLGLPICRAIVEVHGGRIWVTNRPGGGAALRFTLPLPGTPPQVAPETAPPPSESHVADSGSV